MAVVLFVSVTTTMMKTVDFFPVKDGGDKIIHVDDNMQKR